MTMISKLMIRRCPASFPQNRGGRWFGFDQRPGFHEWNVHPAFTGQRRCRPAGAIHSSGQCVSGAGRGFAGAPGDSRWCARGHPSGRRAQRRAGQNRPAQAAAPSAGGLKITGLGRAPAPASPPRCQVGTAPLVPVTASPAGAMGTGAEFAEPPAGKTMCKHHHKTAGEWLCRKCNELFLYRVCDHQTDD